MLKIDNLYAGYSKKDVIHNLSIDINDGELMCIIGPNGCGKSTLFKAIIGIVESRGQMTYNGINLSTLSGKNRSKMIGLLSQNKSSYFSYSIYETVKMGGYTNSDGILHVNIKNHIVEDALRRVDLLDIADKKIDEISGGQFQRAMIARLLTQDPQILMLDEPTNHLDLKHQIDIIQEIKNHVKEQNKIGIISLHDLNLVFKFADKVLLFDNENYFIGKPSEILSNENINKVYGIDVKKWMTELLELWK